MFPKHLVFKDETTKGSALGNEGNRSICVQYFEWLNVPEPDRCITSIDVWEEGNRLTLYKSEAFAREFNFPRYDDWKQAPNPNPFMPPVIKTPAEYDEALYQAIKWNFPQVAIPRIEQYQGDTDVANKRASVADKRANYERYIRNAFPVLRDDYVNERETRRRWDMK
jgi:hypothetical protein